MMYSFIHLIIISLFFISVEPAYAHAIVTKSSLDTQPLKSNERNTVVLFFNTGVELALSKVFLVKKGDVHEEVKITSGQHPGELHILLPPLLPGDYAIKYKVFAADGHFTESALRFRISD